ncbi:MAG: NADPH-dependent FMN reductase [Thermonemataceae bacterium]
MISIVVSTNRQEATSEKVALYYQILLKAQNADSQLINLIDLPTDFIFTALYNNAGKNERFNLIQQAIIDTEKFVFIVPEYNGSFPGVLKAFIDGLPYPSPFKDKKIALVGLSSGIQGGALALSHLSDIFAYLNANVLGTRVKLMQIEKNLVDGKITNDFYNQLLNDQVKKLVAF